MDDKPTIVKTTLLAIQVCVPADWTDEQVHQWVNATNPSGTKTGWVMRKNGSEYLQGDPERMPCAKREGFVHIAFDA
jgi:hypothetical protein